VLAVEPEIVEQYARPGKVRLVFRDVLNHAERSERASEAAACAGRQGQFWPMHKLLFENQNAVWGASGEGLVNLMLDFAEQVEELDQAAFAQCLNDRITLPALQAADAEQRTRGITSQPIFEIEPRRLVGLQSFDAMAAVIEEALK
jgi:protein-disulfide isomerase